jgi:hypothetical protein
MAPATRRALDLVAQALADLGPGAASPVVHRVVSDLLTGPLRDLVLAVDEEGGAA